MKIGIFTFWDSKDNYGQILQCYALQKYLKDLGHEPFLIRYDGSEDHNKALSLKNIKKAFNPKKLFHYLEYKVKSRIIAPKIKVEEEKNSRYFDSFKAQYITSSNVIYHSYKSLKNDLPFADAYIVGSDQIWNSKLYSEKAMHVYFLDFSIYASKKISYAASWGINDIDDEHIKTVSPLLQQFYYVSVREKNGVDLCKKCGVNNAEWVPDPTMLLSVETYRKLYMENPIRKINDKFLLLYMLSNKTDFDIEKVYNYAETKNLKVVLVTGNGFIIKKEKYFATIPEWLYLIDNAEYVITNSFHCGVFCTLFNKKYGIVPLSGAWQSTNSRMTSLFERFGIKERYITNDDFSILEEEYSAKTIEPPVKFLKNLE